MRIINCDEHIQISDLLVKLNYYIALFYYERYLTLELSKFSSLIHLFYHKLEHLYSILDEDDYFDEDD